VSAREHYLNFPEGTLLLDTRLRFGELSYADDDLVVRENTWYPPEEILQSLRRQFGSTPEVQVKLVVRQNTVVQNVYILKHPWWRFWVHCTIL